MTIKVIRCHFEELEKTINEIGYENILNIFSVNYLSANWQEVGNDVGYTIIYKDCVNNTNKKCSICKYFLKGYCLNMEEPVSSDEYCDEFSEVSN